MREKSNKERILGSLLESSKTTGELTTKLGYKDPDGTPRYKIIGRDLKELKEKGWIEGKEIKLGKCKNDPTLNSFVVTIQNLINILKEYPNLIPKLQKNDSILEYIFRENLDLICGFNNLEFLNSRFSGYINKNRSGTSPRTSFRRSDPTFDSSENDRAKYKEAIFFENRERSFKKKLQLSPEFFKLFLITDENK